MTIIETMYNNEKYLVCNKCDTYFVYSLLEDIQIFEKMHNSDCKSRSKPIDIDLDLLS